MEDGEAARAVLKIDGAKIKPRPPTALSVASPRRRLRTSLVPGWKVVMAVKWFVDGVRRLRSRLCIPFSETYCVCRLTRSPSLCLLRAVVYDR